MHKQYSLTSCNFTIGVPSWIPAEHLFTLWMLNTCTVESILCGCFWIPCAIHVMYLPRNSLHSFLWIFHRTCCDQHSQGIFLLVVTRAGRPLGAAEGEPLHKSSRLPSNANYVRLHDSAPLTPLPLFHICRSILEEIVSTLTQQLTAADPIYMVEKLEEKKFKSAEIEASKKPQNKWFNAFNAAALQITDQSGRVDAPPQPSANTS